MMFEQIAEDPEFRARLNTLTEQYESLGRKAALKDVLRWAQAHRAELQKAGVLPSLLTLLLESGAGLTPGANHG